MGQPINVVEKPSSNPGLARFETNRSLTGMGHERYGSVDDILADRPVDELARRLFESGGVTQVHANGSMVTVHLAEGWTGAQLLDVIRGLYIFYPPAAANGDAAEPEPAAVEPQAEAADGEPASDEPTEAALDEAATAPETVTDRETAIEASEAVTEPVDDRVADSDLQK
ncbi:MAG TPA: hypothetical protein VFM27_13995 [Acidimicrobiales bacterium]|nr:hypothetical protein [Acidimicrobiales bacterium]